MLQTVIALMRLVLIDSADVFLGGTTNVRVYPIHICVRVVTDNMLLTPHEGGCPYSI